MEVKMTVMQATKCVLARWEPGTSKYGYEIAEEVRDMVYASTGKRPLDSTVLRYVRYLSGVWRVNVPKRGESKYFKEN